MANLRVDNLTGTGGRNAIDGSVYFSNAAVDFLSVGANGLPFATDHFNFLHNGASDFTAEFWIKPGKDNDRQCVFSTGGNSSSIGFTCRIMEDGASGGSNGYKVLCQFSRGSSGNYLGFLGGILTVGEWAHVALVFTTSNKQLAIYVNGVLTNSSDLDGTANGTFGSGNFASGNSTYPLEIGREPYNRTMYLDGATVSNLRIVEGVTVYTAAFTPPTTNLKEIDGTVLLCCHDMDNPTAEVTGKEMVGTGGVYYGKRYSNIATNGGLETGDTTGWTSSSMSVTPAVSTFSHSGSYSLYCETNVNGSGVYATVNVNTNYRYKISAYIYNVTTGSTLSKMKIGSSVGGNQNYESQKSTPGKWEYHEWIGIPVASTLYIAFVESASGTPVVKWYVDDLRVELWYPEETENILANPNFLTDATGWSLGSDYAISSNRLNITDTSRTSNTYATQQLWPSGIKEGRYRMRVDYSLTAGAFDMGVGNSNVWGLGNTNATDGVTHERVADGNNSNFRIIANQHCIGHINSVGLFRIAEPKRINELPPVGVDEGVTFDGDTKVNTQNYMYFPTGDTSQRGRGRGLMGGGTTPNTNSITFVNIQSGGNAKDFGDLTSARFGLAAFSSSTRGIFVGGATPTRLNEMEYVTIATQSNAVDFGNLEQNVRDTSAGGNNLYGFRGGGAISPAGAKTNMIDKTTIATKGNATDIGNLESNKQTLGACASPTRCVWGGGFWPANINAIQYITIASAGDTVDFGDLTNARSSLGSASSNTRGLWGGGSGPTNIIDYVELATTGNAQDFGDLTLGRTQLSATSNSIRAVFCGGYWSSSDRNIIDYVDIATTGNAKDFGDINRADNDSNREHGVCSDSHGGLS